MWTHPSHSFGSQVVEIREVFILANYQNQTKQSTQTGTTFIPARDEIKTLYLDYKNCFLRRCEIYVRSKWLKLNAAWDERMVLLCEVPNTGFRIRMRIWGARVAQW